MPVLGAPIGVIPEILLLFSEDLILEEYELKLLAKGITAELSGDHT